ncbi:MAG TPA: oligopeptide ABC transporter ATP-binding protein OppF [Deltaproteobacteria bacterium]|nr:oligopeptide ABC transporter ATP-binding protein OppF [Deltaproteobacteria bacterium]
MGEMLSISELTKTFEVRKTAFSIKKHVISALDKVSFFVEKGETLGVVGESGSGKSTLARCILMLEVPDSGTITFAGADLMDLTHNQLRTYRKRMQIIFQDPYSSLNPRHTVYYTIAEPILFHHIAPKEETRKRVIEIFKNVGLDEDFMNKYPHEMSGGQRQRVAIGRALATNPALLIADEPVSSLDVSIQAQIINLFMDIKEQYAITMIFISHDLNIVRFVSDNIIVMYGGKILEMGTKEEVLNHPLHPYTQMLMNASQGKFSHYKGQDIIDISGCLYYPRCQRRKAVCKNSVPPLTGDKDHMVACFKE